MFIKFDRFILILIYYISLSTFLFLFVYDLNTLYYLVALSKNEKHNYINFGKKTTIMIFETNKNLRRLFLSLLGVKIIIFYKLEDFPNKTKF